MAAPRQLSDQKVQDIVKIITNWPLWKHFGWEELRREIKVQFKLADVSEVWSRQQLPKYLAIKDAFDTKKQQIRKYKGKQESSGEEMPAKERKLHDRILALEAENETLRAENDRLHEKFELWLYNAYAKGLTEDALNIPLPRGNIKHKIKTDEKKNGG